MKAERIRMLIFVPGRTEDADSGFILLKGLITMFIVIFCLAIIMTSFFVISKRSHIMYQGIEREIEKRNAEVEKLLNQ
jgi:hypothetical protein